MFGQDEDDADFLSPTGGAKLASLFGVDQMVSAQGNESFQYTAPKQPKKGAPSAGTKVPKSTGAPPAGPVPSVLLATAVHAYKYVNGQYAKQGKFGAAVLGNQTSKEYRILLYISQQQPVTTAKIHPSFSFTVQLNNYAAFYDDQRQSWSVMFESEASAVDFSKQVCIAKCNSAPSLDAVVSQDLTPGDGTVADVGDLLEVAYTGWLYQNLGIGQMFDSNVQKDKQLRLKLGSGKVIKGWEEGMLGMKKGGKRLLVIPPSLAYGSQGLSGRIPPNATLIFEVEVKRMKQKDIGVDRQSIGSRDSPVSMTDSIPTESLPQAPTSVPPKPGEPAVRAKSNSISEQLANPDMAKAKLISRMAKMGQPMLPFLTGSSTPQPDSSDSEIEDPNMQRISPHPAAPLLVRPTPQINQAPAAHIPAPVPQQQSMSSLPSPSGALIPVGPIASQAIPGQAPGFQPYTGIQYAYPPNPAAATQLQPVGHIYPAPVQQPAPYQASGDVTSFLMTEARQQNTEIRMAISKVVDKIDNLASKVDNLQKENASGTSHLLPGISSITMESAMIMNNIQRIVQENERLKQEVLDKSSRIEEQNAKIGELIHRNQRYVEQSNMLMEQRNDSLKTSSETTQAKMLHAMQEKAKVAEELSAATGQVSRLQLEVTAHQKREMELRTQLAAAQQEAEKCRTELTSVQVQLIEVKETSEQTRNRVKTEKESRRSLELRLAALEEELSDLKAEKENLEKSLADRKRKSQQERQRAEEELEDLRRNLQEEAENLRQLLKKTREQAAQEQLSSSSSRDREEQRLLDLQDQAAQLQPLKDKCSQLQSQITSLSEQLRASRARESDANLEKEQLQGKVSQLQDKVSQLQPVRQKCSQLQAQVSSLTEQLREAQTTDGEKTPAKDPTEEVKKIMNGVFQSLRKEFDLEETYSGRAVLGTIMNTIKATTLQLLNKPQAEVAAGSSSEEEEEDEEAETEAASQPALHTEQIRLNNKEKQSDEHKKQEENPSGAVETPPPSLKAQPPAVETPPPSLQARPPAVETPPPSLQARPPAVETLPPSLQARPPAVETPSPALQAQPPAVETPPPALQARPPAVETPPPSLQARPPAVETPPPSLQARPPAVETPPPSLQARPPAVETPPPSLQARPPAVETPPPSLQARPPAVETPPPPLQARPPAVETLPPALQAQPLAVETPPPALQAQPLAVETPPSSVEPAPQVTEEEEAAEEMRNGHLDLDSSLVTLPTYTDLAEVKEDEPVEVIQEDLDTPSALVHMISSDTPESSTIVYTEEDQRISIAEDGRLENSTGAPSTEPPTVAKEDLSQEEELNQSKVSTVTVASSDFEETKREAPPPLGSDDESSSPVPPILSSTQEKRQKTEKKSSGPRLNESDEEDLFKAAALKPKPKNEEEEDEEVILKGRPPPAPLFGDEDEDDEDLDWLG